MRKSEAVNTFAQGLVMDINPLVAPNDGVCNALNATLITMNGNENVLQNDMGNARVETAFLPEGYVPLGTTELGGIIYVVSYNPLNKRCQIGSFPSPERNITSNEVGDLDVQLSNDDFKFTKNLGALIYNVKKDLNSNLTFNPGDKFIVYADNLIKNYDQLYDEEKYKLNNQDDFDATYDIISKHTLKLSIGAITSMGKLVRFDNLKQYDLSKVEKDENGEKVTTRKYHIFQYSGDKSISDKDLDKYRSLVSQPYNIFSSKISGTLVLIAELVQFNDFDVSINNTIEEINETKVIKKRYTPSATFTFSGDYPFVPNSIECDFTLFNKSGESIAQYNYYYEIPKEDIKNQFTKGNATFYEFSPADILRRNNALVNNISEKLKELENNRYFGTNTREPYTLKYEFTPCMNWGKISHLAVRGQVSLDKIGTGYIDISQWRYYNESNKCNLTWGLEIYEEEDHYVSGVKMEFTRLVKPAETKTDPETGSEITKKGEVETITYQVNSKASYFGVFYESFPFNEPSFRLDGILKPNCLYLAKIIVTYSSTKGSTKDSTDDGSINKEFYRWMYTNEVFNQYYKDTEDFKDLTLNFTPKLDLDYTDSYTEQKSVAYGIIKKVTQDLTDEEKENALNPKTSLSAIQTQRDFTVTGKLAVGLVEDYNTFQIGVQNGDFDITLDTNSCNITSSSEIRYSDREHESQDKYLYSKDERVYNDNDFNKYKLASTSGEDISDIILGTPEIPAQLPTFDNPDGTPAIPAKPGIPTNVVKLGNLTTSFGDNIYNLNFAYSALQMVKAYCTKIESTLNYKGKYLPLAYDKETFAKYNLEWDGNSWVPSIVGLFGFTKGGNKAGRLWIGLWDRQSNKDSEKEQVSRTNELAWTTNPDIVSGQVQTGWEGTAIFIFHKYSYEGGNRKDQIQCQASNISGRAIFSMPNYLSKRYNRFQLAFKSNNGDEYFYPINFSAMNKNELERVNSTSGALNQIREESGDFSNDLAQYLNNIYRYDPQAILQYCVIPKYIYWMDQCKYSLSVPISVNSNTENYDPKIFLNLDKEETGGINKILLNQMTTQMIWNDILTNGDYLTLQNNIRSTINKITNKYEIKVVNTDDTSGIEMRNHMLDSTETIGDTLIMNFDGVTELATTPDPGDTKTLYVVQNNNEIYSMCRPEEFYPKKIQYNDGSFSSVSTEDLETGIHIKLNDSFTLNDNNMLVLKDPRPLEIKMYTVVESGGTHSAPATGYQKLTLFTKYRAY